MKILNLPVITFISSLLGLFDGREDALNISANCTEIDEKIEIFLTGLPEYPSNNWLSFCTGMDCSPIMITAATYCTDFEWKTFDSLIAAQEWRAAPLNPASIAASFSYTPPLDLASATLTDIAALEFHPKTISFILSALDCCPVLDLNTSTLARVEAGIARMLAWFMARDGFDAAGEAVLYEWTNRSEAELRFWAGFALLLRKSDLRDQSSRLETTIEGDPIRQHLYNAFVQALKEGPYPDDALNTAFLELNEGPCHSRWVRALRFAAFSENAPLIDPTARTKNREKQIQRLELYLFKA